MIKLTDKSVATLLGITQVEYKALSHKPLKAFFDWNGKVKGYYIHVSPENSAALLEKLNVDKRNFVCFKPEQLHKFETKSA